MNSGLLMFSVGDEFPVDTASEGLAVTVVPDYGMIYVVQDLREGVFTEGPIQIGMVDAPPFGWFLRNGGPTGWCETCWTIGLVSEPERAEIVAFLEEIQKDHGRYAGSISAFLILAVNPYTSRITGMRFIGLRAGTWKKIATVLLSHRRNLTAEKCEYLRHRWDAKLDSMEDFTDHGLAFIESFGF